jgi:hypothetical protein
MCWRCRRGSVESNGAAALPCAEIGAGNGNFHSDGARSPAEARDRWGRGSRGPTVRTAPAASRHGYDQPEGQQGQVSLAQTRGTEATEGALLLASKNVTILLATAIGTAAPINVIPTEKHRYDLVVDVEGPDPPRPGNNPEHPADNERRPNERSGRPMIAKVGSHMAPSGRMAMKLGGTFSHLGAKRRRRGSSAS